MLIAGVDEVGRGPLAGPVVAAAVVFEEGYCNPVIKDSKKLSAKKREYLIDVIKRDAHDWAIVSIGARRIDQGNILKASLHAMSLAVQRVRADFLLIDGPYTIDSPIEQLAVIGGDALHVEISAASILAKVWRDQLMAKLGKKYPGYGLEKHMGYPTSAHRTAIQLLGPSRIHRKTFRGVREYVSNVTEYHSPTKMVEEAWRQPQ